MCNSFSLSYSLELPIYTLHKGGKSKVRKREPVSYGFVKGNPGTAAEKVNILIVSCPDSTSYETNVVWSPDPSCMGRARKGRGRKGLVNN